MNKSPQELFRIKEDSTIAMMMNEEKVIDTFDEVRRELLLTIPFTKAADKEDREGIYFLVRAVDLIQLAMQAKANDFNALIEDEKQKEEIDAQVSDDKNRGRSV